MENPSILNIIENCTGCGACAAVCPKDCITIGEDKYGFYYPIVKLDKCISCGACDKSCHVLSKSNQYESPIWWHNSEAYAYQTKNEKTLLNSTSGGAFTLFSNYVLDKGGVIYASKYNGEKNKLEFSSTDFYDLKVFRKSRYMESNTNNVFEKIKIDIKKGRFVLFTGTPCQVAGLKALLHNKEIENLITINFICHGVPSNLHFHQWLHSKYPKIGNIDNVDFRYKNLITKKGWHDMILMIEDKTGGLIKIPYNQSSYYLSFLSNDLLRKSCYNCQIINNTYADITIADFWGINKFNPDMDDDKGVSLVILHTEKAKELFLKITANNERVELPHNAYEYAFRLKSHNYSISKRKEIESLVDKLGYVKALDKLYRMKIIKYRLMHLLYINKLLTWLKI